VLEPLRSIVQEVSLAKNIKTALDIITLRVQEAINTDVCSIYLLDPQTERYVFMSTQGLNKEAEGRLSLAKNQGLVGLVAEREEPINLDNAPAHPAFKFLPDIGEEPFNAFMGTPIIHQRKVLGVLVIQQKESRRFTEMEESFLVTISAQIAGVIAHAQVTGALTQIDEKQSAKKDIRFSGISGAVGVAIGQVEIVSPQADLHTVADKRCNDIEEEIDFFNVCLDAVREDIKDICEKLARRISAQEVALFDAYLQMLDDNAIGGEVEARIRTGQWAQGALSEVVLAHMHAFESMEDAYLRERAADVKDLGLRILAYLQQAEPVSHEYQNEVILVAEELTASMLGMVPREKLIGLVSVYGSSNSHVAILARSMGIPTVMGVVGMPYKKLNGQIIIVDGYRGIVLANASEALLNRYKDVCEEEKLAIKGLEQIKDLPCETLDKHSIPLFVNTGLMVDVVRSLENGADGVGLFRTEVPFLLSERFPSEEEQREIYRGQLEAFHPKPVIMRTLDIGGDKSLPYFPIEEDNPFLGWRGIRVTLDHPEIFLVQIRAMLKASTGLNNLQILLPMVASMSELVDAKELIKRAFAELIAEEWDIKLPAIGVMIEVPSAVYIMPDLAKKADFFSVGSNDLTQYLLAVDRNNSRVADLYEKYHPAVFRACNIIAQIAKEAGKPVSVCGELAGDPAAAMLLMAMGYDHLSMNASSIPRVKSLIRLIEFTTAKKLLDVVLKLDNALDIEDYLARNLKNVGITSLFNMNNDV
jgi:phosphotransferase system enzyme I (PtsP)